MPRPKVQDHFFDRDEALRRAVELRRSGEEIVYVIASGGEYWVENYASIIRSWESVIDVQKKGG